MKAKIIYWKKGRWLLSKQNSCNISKYGVYKKKAYKSEQEWYAWNARYQLNKQGWICTGLRVSLDIKLFGKVPPTDWDNIGVLTDALQGIAYKNDRQCFPVKVDWIKAKERKIELTLKTIPSDSKNIKRG